MGVISSANGYESEPAVVVEIARLSSLTASRQIAMLTADGAPTERASEEALVHFARRFNAAGDSRNAAIVAKILTGRVSRKIARMASLWRLHIPPDLLDDIADEILTALYDAVFKADAGSDFWEVRFWVCFNRRVLNILRHRRFELDQIAADEFGDDEETLSYTAESDAQPSASMSPEARALVADALSRLPTEWRTAFVLKHWAGYNEEASMDGSPTIASLMGVTGRTVRNYLTKAESALAKWRGIEEDQLNA